MEHEVDFNDSSRDFKLVHFYIFFLSALVVKLIPLFDPKKAYIIKKYAIIKKNQQAFSLKTILYYNWLNIGRIDIIRDKFCRCHNGTTMNKRLSW